MTLVTVPTDVMEPMYSPMLDVSAIGTVGATLTNAARALGRVHCCATPNQCWATDTADVIENLVMDLTQLGYRRGQPLDPATWLPDHEWIPAAWGSQSSTPQVQVAACHNALRAVITTYDDVLLDRRIPAHLTAKLNAQREAIATIDRQLLQALNTTTLDRRLPLTTSH